jgi:hypothetical protein
MHNKLLRVPALGRGEVSLSEGLPDASFLTAALPSSLSPCSTTPFSDNPSLSESSSSRKTATMRSRSEHNMVLRSFSDSGGSRDFLDAEFLLSGTFEAALAASALLSGAFPDRV